MRDLNRPWWQIAIWVVLWLLVVGLSIGIIVVGGKLWLERDVRPAIEQVRERGLKNILEPWWEGTTETR